MPDPIWPCCDCCGHAHKYPHDEPCPVHQNRAMTDADVCRCTCGAWTFYGAKCWYCERIQPPAPRKSLNPKGKK